MEVKTSAQPVAVEQPVCYHCGLTCSTRDIVLGDKYFCCRGCRMVYELLEANHLCRYYDLSRNPGNSPGEFDAETRFGYLDDPHIQRRLLDFSDGQTARVTFFIPSMHCSSCIWLLESLHKINAGILSSRVNFLRKELTLTFSQKALSLRQVVELLAFLGYEPQISMADLEKRSRRGGRRDLYLKIGVAGFAFGNIMLLSLPEYFSGGQIETGFKQFFGWLNILLALPVLLYSSTEYFSSAWTGLKHRTINIDLPISLGILALFGRSVFEIVTGLGPGYMDSFAALLFFLLTGKLFQKKTYDALSFERDFKSYFPIAVTRKVGDREETIPLSRLRVGDRILVRHQELVPADAVLIAGDGWIDYSFVTGESAPVARKSGDLIYAGARQMASTIELEVVKEVSQSYLTRLWNDEIFRKQRDSRFQSIINVAARYFTVFVLAVASGALLYWLPRDAGLALNAFTAVLIIACPCALALTVPYTLGSAMRILGRKHFYLKNTHVIEVLARVDTVIFDKTGTLTQSRRAAVQFVPMNGTTPLAPEEEQWIRSLVYHSTHPLSRRIRQALSRTALMPVKDYREIPGRGIEAVVQGRHIRVGSGKFLGIAPPEEKEAGGLPDAESSRVFVAIDGRVKGYFHIWNVYRSGLKEILQNLAGHYQLALLSGDYEQEKQYLRRLFPLKSDLLFQQSPQQKLEYIRTLQQQGRTVLMVGDGLNDAGALKQSDVGVAVTEDRSAFFPACDALLDAGHFRLLPDFLRLGKISRRIILASIGISLLYNLVGLSFAVQGTLSPVISAILMPLSSISVVAFTTGMTHLWARIKGLW